MEEKEPLKDDSEEELESSEEESEEIEEDTSEKTEGEEDTSEEKREGEVAEKKEPDWKAKSKAIYAKYKALKEKLKKLEGGSQAKSEPKEAVDDAWKAKVEFLLANKDKGYTEEEFNHIATVAKEFDISLEEAASLEDDYIQYRREKVAKEKNIPEPSSPSAKIEKLSPEDIAKMSPEEHRKLFEEMLKKRRSAGEGL